jgi:hypothetical protein
MPKSLVRALLARIRFEQRIGSLTQNLYVDVLTAFRLFSNLKENENKKNKGKI